MVIAAPDPASANWMLEIVKIAGPFFTGLLGAWIGGRWALSKHKSERAFDRRIDWYERMTRSLYEISWYFATAAHFTKQGLHYEAQEVLAEATKLVGKIALTGAESTLYANEKGARAYREFRDSVNSLGVQIGVATAAGVNVAEFSAQVAADLAGAAADEIAAEFRSEFGWAPLPAGARLVPVRQKEGGSEGRRLAGWVRRLRMRQKRS